MYVTEHTGRIVLSIYILISTSDRVWAVGGSPGSLSGSTADLIGSVILFIVTIMVNIRTIPSSCSA